MKILSHSDLRERGIRWTKQHIWRKVRSREFPLPVHLGPSTVGWVEDEVDAWLKARAAERKIA